MKICEIEFASSSIAFSMQIVNELELNLFSLEFNYLRTTSLELNSVKRVRVKLNFSQTRDVSKFNFSRNRAAVASNIRFIERYANIYCILEKLKRYTLHSKRRSHFQPT